MKQSNEVLLWNVTHREGEPQIAEKIDLNSTEVQQFGFPLENDFFKGRISMMQRPANKSEEAQDYPFKWHFEGRKRTWEMRVQGRFSPEARGLDFFGGIELGEYVPVGITEKMSMRAIVSFLRRILSEDLYHSVGDDPTHDDPEPPVAVGPLAAVDKFIISEPGKEPPLTGSWEGLGVDRAEMGIRRFVQYCQGVEFDSDKVFSLAFWGCSAYMDLRDWQMKTPMTGSIGMSQFCGPNPAHWAFYLLDRKEGEQRHMRRDKRYLFDLLVTSSAFPPSEAFMKQYGQGTQEAPESKPLIDGLERLLQIPQNKGAEFWWQFVSLPLDCPACPLHTELLDKAQKAMIELLLTASAADAILDRPLRPEQLAPALSVAAQMLDKSMPVRGNGPLPMAFSQCSASALESHRLVLLQRLRTSLFVLQHLRQCWPEAGKGTVQERMDALRTCQACLAPSIGVSSAVQTQVEKPARGGCGMTPLTKGVVKFFQKATKFKPFFFL